MGEVVQITRGAQIPAHLRRTAVRVGNLTDANRRIANDAARYARQEAPIRRGMLMESVRVFELTRGGWQIGSRKVYAGPIHWGWARRNIAPNHFMSRGLARARVVDEYEESMEELLRTI